MLYTYDYDRSYNPSMPIAQVEIWHGTTSPPLALNAIIDSGADATMLPMTYLQQIGARIHDHVWLHGVTAYRTEVDLYTISLRVAGYTRHDLSVVGDPSGQDVILGRDLLNDLQVTLNGLAGVVEIVG